jgi:hypothetical protein
MNRSRRNLLVIAGVIIGTVNAMATEEAKYTVVEKAGRCELRDYAPHVLAETTVDGTLEEAGNKAFRRLFRYISGDNQSRGKVAMTAPVAQEARGAKISMTAPVGQQRLNDQWAVSFMMPASYTLDTLPVPDDPNVKLRQVPVRRMAAIRYSGRWSEKAYLHHKQELEAWIQKQGMVMDGEPVWARYNPPFTPWFLRRNEILIPVKAGGGKEAIGGDRR